MNLPPGWSFDPEYDATPAWWHDDCPTPTLLPDGSQIGGIAFEERVNGHLVAVHCVDCDAHFPIRQRPKSAVESL